MNPNRASEHPTVKAGRSPHPLVVVLLALIVLYGLAMRLFTAFLPLDQLIGICLADDAFYYFEIARNILAGNGATFDGQIATNGFHPLYMGLCVLFSAAFPGEFVVLPVMIFFAVVGAINTLLLYFLGRRIGGEAAGIAAAGFWTLHPYPQFMEMMGVEAPLAVLFLLAASLWWLGVKSERLDTNRGWIVLGLLVGLAFLARTDTIFFALFLALEVLILSRKGQSGRLKRAALGGSVSLLVVLPWLVWNLVTFGRITQDSGRALYAFPRLLNDVLGIPFAQAVRHQVPWAVRDTLIRFVGFLDLHNGVLALFIAISAGVVAWAFLRDDKVGAWRGAPAFILTGLGTWGFYNFIFWTRKNWYFLLFLAAVALLFGRLVGLYADRTRRMRWPFVLAVLCLLAHFWFATTNAIEWQGFHRWQTTYLDVARDIEEGRIKSIGPSAVIGAWNAGIYGSFCGRRVVNLDGVVNPKAHEAVRAGRFFSYVREAGITHLIDHEVMLNDYQLFSKLAFRDYLKLNTRYKGPPGAGDVLVLEIRDEPLPEQSDTESAGEKPGP